MRIRFDLVSPARLAAAMRRAQGRHERGISRGLYLAGLYLFSEAELLLPVDTGTLRASGFVRRDGVGRYTVVSVGYTASYAMYAHEELQYIHGAAYNARYAYQIQNRHRYTVTRDGVTFHMIYHERRPQEQAKFLTTPFYSGRGVMIALIVREARRG